MTENIFFVDTTLDFSISKIPAFRTSAAQASLSLGPFKIPCTILIPREGSARSRCDSSYHAFCINDLTLALFAPGRPQLASILFWPPKLLGAVVQLPD